MVARDVIEAAAVLGTDFSPEALSQVTGNNPLEVGIALEELERRRLVALEQRTPGNLRYRFIHDIFREALLLKIHPVRARWLHARTAQYLESGPETRDKPALLAQHYEQAGETEMALGYWIQSGQRAHQLYSFQEADWAFSRAESLIDPARAPDEGQILSLYSAWSELAYEAGDASKTQEINSKMLRLGELSHSPLLVGSALDGLSTAFLLTREAEQGLALADQAIRYLGRAAHPLKMMDATIHRGMLLSQSRRYADAVAAFQQAIDTAAHSDDAQALARRASARTHQSQALLMDGWPQRAQEVASQALEDYSTLNLIRGQISATYTLALARLHCGELTQALNDSRTGATLAQRLDLVLQAGLFHGLTGTIEMSLGNFDLAIDNAQRCIELGEGSNLETLTARGYHLCGELLIRLQDYPGAAEYLTRASAANAEPSLEAYPSLGLGYALWQSNRTPASRQILENALKAAEESQIYHLLANARLAWVETEVQPWDNEQRQAYLAELYQQADERGLTLMKLGATGSAGQAGDLPRRFRWSDPDRPRRDRDCQPAQPGMAGAAAPLAAGWRPQSLRASRPHEPRAGFIPHRAPGERVEPRAVQRCIFGVSELPPDAACLIFNPNRAGNQLKGRAPNVAAYWQKLPELGIKFLTKLTFWRHFGDAPALYCRQFIGCRYYQS